jgi:glycosyltransferase involved in cell wall biosynthesis
MAEGKRILYVTNGFPYPLTSGYLRHYYLIGELARAGFRVVLLSIVGVDHRPEDAAAMTDRTERIETFPSFDRTRSRRQTLARRAGRVLPLAGGDPAARRLARRIEELVRTESFDAVVFSGRRTEPALHQLDELPVVVDMCDATSLRLEREMAVAPAGRRAALMLEARQIRRTERRMIDRADHLLFASVRDLEALLPGPPDPRASVVPNGVESDIWDRTTPRLGTDTIVLTGAMSYGPNVDAAIVLARTILPRVREVHPDARLLIVGRDPTPAVQALGDLPGVTVTGFVEEVRPYLEEASVFAAPLRFGAGIQNKLLEAMAMQVPSVVSALAADGLRNATGEMPPVVVEDEPVAFAAALVEALDRAASDGTPDAAARAYVARNFDWGRSGDDLATILEDVTSKHASSG